MEPTRNDLVPRASGLTPLDAWENDDEAARLRLFGAMRKVFSSAYQLERIVFWVEERAGAYIVRSVTNLARTRKGEDKLVARVPPDLAAVRVAIGNYAAGAYMTPTRWELYRDFELTELEACGRFDIRDLLGDFSHEEVKSLMTRGVRPTGDWDFDFLRPLHQCLVCRGMYNPDWLILALGAECATCKQVIPVLNGRSLFSVLLSRYHKRRSLPRFRRRELPTFPIQDFVDPFANSFALWFVMNGCPRDWFQGPDTLQVSREVCNASLFRLAYTDILRENLLQHLERLGERNWEVFLGAAGKFSLMLDGSTDREFHLLMEGGYGHQLVTEFLPTFINSVIVASGDFLAEG